MLKGRKIPLLALAILLFSAGISWGENIYDLPISLTPGNKPNPACYTQNGYQDDSLTVRMEKLKLPRGTVDLAWIKVKSPTQLRTAIYGEPGNIYNDEPGALVRRSNAVVAVNGDKLTERKHGLIYRMGVMLQQTASPEKDSLFIDENGDFHAFVHSDPKEMAQFLKDGHKIINAFCFGPAMVIDGKAQTIGKYDFECLTEAPRTIICQVGPLEYLFIEIEGRHKDSRGMTMQDAAYYAESLGVQTAYNLDGGNSSIMFFNRKYFDEHYSGSERPMSDIVYVCSAVDPKTWEK